MYYCSSDSMSENYGDFIFEMSFIFNFTMQCKLENYVFFYCLIRSQNL